VLKDIGACKLRSVSWVIPTGANSDHAKSNDGGGPSWVSAIVNAIGNSSACDDGAGYWQDTAIVITWDDWGGWYDHVAPPPIPATGWGQSYVYGFRVPLLVVSAYTPAGYVDDATHDFGSMLRFAESNFGLSLIGTGYFADAYADDLSAFFTLSTPRKFVQIQAPKVNFAKQPLTDPDTD
jgi:phospholipase C